MARKDATKRLQQTEVEHALEVLARIREGSRKGAETTRRLIEFAKANMSRPKSAA